MDTRAYRTIPELAALCGAGRDYRFDTGQFDRRIVREKPMYDPYEMVKPNTPVQCGGPQASEYAKTLFPQGQRVQLVADSSQDAHDRYGRTLAFVLLPSGLNYSIDATRTGHARAYTYGHRPSRWASEIAAAEHQAQADRTGIWGPPCEGSTQMPQGGA
ncbi:hypothetical protein EJ571_24890 [Mycobacteroides franklinii]|uniref:TNase-like domain-containing protein n=1 Tax=Mycobacteroides franklinii TaxID=948102 RepID=A0A4V3A5I7_9MYCO|nr:hypothetical protein EJ571_24890 [Mycobacteroides franklinii]